jgi:hypothetical protein
LYYTGFLDIYRLQLASEARLLLVPLTITDYEAENAALKDSIAILTKQVQGLAEQVKQAF